MGYGPGVSRLNTSAGSVNYFDNTFGKVGASAGVPAIQGAITPAGRRMAVSFHAQKTYAGAVGVYSGN